MIVSAARSLLLDDAGIVSLVGEKIHSDHFPQTLTPPAVVMWTVSTVANDLLEGPLWFDSSSVQVDCYGLTRKAADELWNRVRRKLLLPRTQRVWEGLDIKEISQDGGPRYATDRVQQGTDQYRFITSQDFNFYYCSEVVPS